MYRIRGKPTTSALSFNSEIHPVPAIRSNMNSYAGSAAVSMSSSSANGAKQHSTSGIAASGAQVILA